ncbi:ABC transporter ATP-binding protein [Nocardioides sp. Root140]|uniref:ABC transporter ATP-binding protein n=1 Tax=Nocardioides sp. Root140 TaxID=1736460 RepID=UPI0006F28483|nr:ABC transporter ATP-binding protein [Nocardioides sp. Root140]KQY64433.1 ABC transporter ATP-binding protein [Nocardioides sp. Root140]
MNALELTDVTLTYPDGASRLTAVDHASLVVPRGALTALVGPSGSGKSSLLAVAATLITPDTGRVVVDGVDTGTLSAGQRTQLRRDRVGLVFQQPNLIDSLTALEQLTVTASLAGRSRRTATGEARDLLTDVGLLEQSDRLPAQLSGGQRQRVNIARALMGSPALLLVDEPTSALDHERGAEVMALIRRMTVDRNVGTVLVTHDTGHLGDDDRVVECVDGRLRESAPV